VLCGSACTDLSQDPANCGACGTACAAACMSGKCVAAVELSGADYEVCAAMSNGAALCWGNIGWPPQAPVGGLPYVAEIDVAAADTDPLAVNTCVVTPTGGASCFGLNTYGQGGNGNMLSECAPSPVLASGFAHVSTGQGHTCSLMLDGTLRCFGQNASGQLGIGSTTDADTPQTVPGIASATQISAGWSHTCALAGGVLRCWGDNTYGQIGDGTTTNRLSPVVIPAAGALTYTFVSAGAMNTCAVRSDGTVVCWGDNSRVQCGANAPANMAASPIAVPNITTAKAVAVGYDHVCALLTGGTVECWGDNDDGELGDGTMGSEGVPVQAMGLAGVTRLVASLDYTCALLGTGAVKCWGSDINGCLGDGGSSDGVLPQPVIWYTPM
jgi:alpha-tubulin suppressor-like RCC1 family protein